MGRRYNSGLCTGVKQTSLENYELERKLSERASAYNLQEEVKEYSKGIESKSQPYSTTYSVVKEEFEKDKMDNDIYGSKKGYFKNPTTVKIQDAIIDNQVYINGNKAHGDFTYVLDQNDNLLIAKRVNPNNSDKRSPHPTLIGGLNPVVKCAGMINFSKGKICSVDNQSGHYRPNIESMRHVYEILDELHKSNPEAFSKKKWRKNNDS